MKKREVVDGKNGNKNIWLLGSSSMFNDAGNEIITPILPFYIAAFGGGGVALGLLGGLREGISSIIKLLGGWLSDKLGKRKGIILFGYFLSTILKFFVGLAGSWQQIITFVSFERAGKVRDPPRDALISSSTKNRGRGFGIHQMMDTIGGIIGATLAIIFLGYLGLSFKTIIFIAAGISALSLIPLFFVKEKPFQKTNKSLYFGIRHLNKKLVYSIIVTCVFALASFSLYLFMITRVKDLSGSNIIALTLFVLFNIVGALMVIPLSSLSDKLGRKDVLAGAYLLFIVVSVGFAYFTSLLPLAILFAMYGVAYTLTEATQKALVSDLAGEMKGTALGVYHGARGIISIIAGLIAGLIWDISPTMMFSYLAIVGVVALFLVLFIRENKNGK